jgi:hypothetical protein
MNIYLISQRERTGYNTFDSAVMIAPDEETARRMNPSNGKIMEKRDWESVFRSWASSPDFVEVELIGQAASDRPQGVVCSSFNEG